MFHPLPVFIKYDFLSVLDSKMRIKSRKSVGTWDVRFVKEGSCENTKSPPWQAAFCNSA